MDSKPKDVIILYQSEGLVQQTIYTAQFQSGYEESNGHIPDMYTPKEWTFSYLKSRVKLPNIFNIYVSIIPTT